MFETIQFRTPATFFGMDMINQLGKEASDCQAAGNES